MAASFTQKYGFVGLLCLLVALNFPNKAKAAYSMNETCAYIQKGYIGDPTSCQNWGYCSGGSLLGSGTCNTGLLYDSAAGICNYANQVQCQTSLQDTCNSLNEAQYISDPNNCNAYAYCNNKVLENFNCPQYQIFNPTTVRCEWAAGNTCAANSICRLVQNNQFAEDPNVCGNYIRCQNGAGLSTPCPTGTNFNPINGACDYSKVCTANPGGPPSSNPSIPTTNAQICPAEYVTTVTGTQYFTDNQTCYGFYSCDTATSVGLWGSCPFATHFDPTLQECVTPYTYPCPYNRCGNIASSFMAAQGCEDYYVCSNQQNVTTGNCGTYHTDFPYLDEVSGACVVTSPNYTICSAAS